MLILFCVMFQRPPSQNNSLFSAPDADAQSTRSGDTPGPNSAPSNCSNANNDNASEIGKHISLMPLSRTVYFSLACRYDSVCSLPPKYITYMKLIKYLSINTMISISIIAIYPLKVPHEINMMLKWNLWKVTGIVGCKEQDRSRLDIQSCKEIVSPDH